MRAVQSGVYDWSTTTVAGVAAVTSRSTAPASWRVTTTWAEPTGGLWSLLSMITGPNGADPSFDTASSGPLAVATAAAEKAKGRTPGTSLIVTPGSCSTGDAPAGTSLGDET